MNHLKKIQYLLMSVRLLFFCLFLSLAACMPEPRQRLVWSDEFDHDGQPDSAKWSYDIGSGLQDGWGNNEQEYYTSDAKNVRVENGALIIEAQKDSTFKKPFTSSRLITKKKGDWRYGRVEVKAKYPILRGTWAAIWMMPSEATYGNWPASGEIDIMEHVGFDPGVVHGTIHTESYNHIKQTQKEGKTVVEHPDQAFHVYAVDWTENKIDFLVDDRPFYSVARDPKEDFKGWPFDKPFYLILNLAIGGNWGGQKGIEEQGWPQRVEIDYVRVYQSN